MKYFSNILRIMIATILLLSMAACNNDDLEGYTASTKKPTSGNEEIMTDPKSLLFDASGGEKSFTITSNTSWTVKSNSEEWCSIKEGSTGNNNGIVTVEVKQNSTGSPARDAIITILSSSKSCIVNVHQEKGPDKDIPGSDDNPNPSY